MLLDRIDEERAASFCEKAGKQPAFLPEKYVIFHRFDTAAGTVSYLAVRKDLWDETVPPGYWFSISADLKIEYSPDYPWLPLLTYLRSLEQQLSADQQKEIYGDAWYSLGAVAGLSAAERAEREKARRSFLSFLDRVREKGLLTEQSGETQGLRLSFEMQGTPQEKRKVSFRLKMGKNDGRLFYVPSARLFCQTLKTGGELKLGTRFSARLTPDAFEEAWQPLIRQFEDHVHPCGDTGFANYFQVFWNHLPAFLSLLPGEGQNALTSADGNAWTVQMEEKPASISLDSSGELTLYPKAGQKKTYCSISGKRIAVMDPAKHTASVYQFEDDITSELYQYFMGRTAREVSYVSDLLIQQVVPASTRILRKSGDHDFRITVHISLEDRMLRFRTEYLIGEEKKEASFFEGKQMEQALIRTCSSVLRSLRGTENGTVEDPEDIFFFLRSDLEPLRQVAAVYVDDRIKNLKIRSAPPVQIQAVHERGWLNLSFHSSEYTPEELEQIYAAYRQKKTFFLLKDNLILLEAEKMAPVEEIIGETGAENSMAGVRLPFCFAMLLDGYQEAGMDVSADDYVQKALSAVVGYKNARLRMGPALRDVLRPYQADAVRWMKALSKYGFSGILADDMGLGKTLEVLAFLASEESRKPVLVVCPKSLVYNWRNEIRKWLGDVPVIVIAGKKSDRISLIRSIPEEERVFCIAGYDSLRLDVDAYEGKTFCMTLVDEAQNIKNASTQKARAIRKIDSGMRMALTGTPVENSLMDLWSICDYLMPGYLGSEKDFREKYESAEHPEEARAKLARKIAPFLLRRRKEEVLDSLPPKEVVQVTVSMTDQQRDIYEAYLNKARELAKTEKGLSIFSALTRLRQICIDPSSFLEDYEEMPAKLSVALDQVCAAIEGGHQVLVFSSFTRVLDHFRYYLEERDIRSYTINGDTPGALRVEMAEKFNLEGRVRVMLVSVKAGGTGLNLTGADTVIHLDPWWNFAVEEQATDRAHRIGQTKPVTVYKLISHDTIEEKVVALQEEKRRISGDVVQTGVDGMESMTQEDIQFILQS